MVSISDLSQELVDIIVDEFKGDQRNLRTCALISPAFVPSARKHLFGSMRLSEHNVHHFQALIGFSLVVASYVRHLVVSITSSESVITLEPTILEDLTNLTHLAAYDDPFGFRSLSPAQESVLVAAVRRLKTVEIFLHQLWTLPAWASFLNECPLLRTLLVRGTATGSETWSSADVVARMPQSSTSAPTTTPGILRLHTLHVSGDCKVLAPLSTWLIPQGALAALHTLIIDVRFDRDDYDADDARVPLIRAAAASLRELQLLDPPLPNHITIASFPNLRALYLPYVFDLEFAAPLDWIVAFFSATYSHESAFEHLSLDPATARVFLLEMPAPMWSSLEDALLGASHSSVGASVRHPSLRTVTISGYENSVDIPPNAHEHFAQTMRERLPRLLERGLLVFTDRSTYD